VKAGWLGLATLLLLLAGCATTRPVATFASPEEAIRDAEVAAEEGRWTDALMTLGDAQLQFPADPALAERRAQLQERWTQLKAEWEDRLVMVRAQGLRNELTLLEWLDAAEPGGFTASFQLARERALLTRYREGLLICARRQQESDLALAHDCVELAYWLESDPVATELKAAIERRQEQLAAAARAEQLRKEQARRNAKLESAQALLADGRLQRAAALIQQVLAAEPEHEPAKVLQARVTAELASRTRALGDIADRLYAEGRITAAIRVWEMSLQVDPDQPAVLERYERAQRVQNRLEQLRQGKPAPGGVEVDSE
jgi:predicted Zn-dependent protease